MAKKKANSAIVAIGKAMKAAKSGNAKKLRSALKAVYKTGKDSGLRACAVRLGRRGGQATARRKRKK